jgi:predicted nuclease of predicted toxin-antitoxin system
MSLRFFLDEDMNPQVAAGLRVRGIDAVAAHEVGRANQRIADDDQLRYATAEGRVLVTYNRADFQMLDSQWRQAGRTHAGILWCRERIIPRRAIGALISALEAVGRDRDSLEDLCLPLRRAP